MIQIDRLSVTFGEGAQAVRALEEVSLAVAKGESFGLVGESGSGKSTVLRVLAGLVATWTGEIAVDARPLGARRDLAFRKAVQMVFQDPYGSLHPRHTIDRILAEPVAIHRLGDGDRRVREALAAVGLTPATRFRFPHQLSGGQRQRVAIARALILEPEIVLLDEPTSALDVSVQAEVLNLLADLRQRRGLTYLFVSHNLAVVAQMCDRLAVMRKGRIVETTTVAALRTGALATPYARELLASSEGYDRDLALRLTAVEAL